MDGIKDDPAPARILPARRPTPRPWDSILPHLAAWVFAGLIWAGIWVGAAWLFRGYDALAHLRALFGW